MENLKVLPLMALLCLFCTIDLTAQELATVDPHTPIEIREGGASKEKEIPFEISGFVDVYYQYHLNENPFPTNFTESHNSFSLGMANVVMSKEGKVGFKADLAVGPRAETATIVLVRWP